MSVDLTLKSQSHRNLWGNHAKEAWATVALRGCNSDVMNVAVIDDVACSGLVIDVVLLVVQVRLFGSSLLDCWFAVMVSA